MPRSELGSQNYRCCTNRGKKWAAQHLGTDRQGTAVSAAFESESFQKRTQMKAGMLSGGKLHPLSCATRHQVLWKKKKPHPTVMLKNQSFFALAWYSN